LKHNFPVPIRKFRKREAFIATGTINAQSNSRVDRFPCLHQQTHENKTDQHATYNTLKSVPSSSMIAADNSTGTYIIHYSMELIEFSAKYTLFNDCNFNLVYRYSLSVNLTLPITV